MIIATYEKGWMDKRADEMYWKNLCRAMNQELQMVYRVNDAEIPDGYKVIVLDETGDIELPDFKHPEKAAYVFGKSGQISIQTQVNADYVVKVPLLDEEKIGVFGISIAPIVLYDRMVKWHQ